MRLRHIADQSSVFGLSGRTCWAPLPGNTGW